MILAKRVGIIITLIQRIINLNRSKSNVKEFRDFGIIVDADCLFK